MSSSTPIDVKKYQLLSEELNTEKASDGMVTTLEKLYKDEKGTKQIPKEYHKDLDYCGQPVPLFCYQNPSNCKDLFQEYIQNVTMDGIKSSTTNVYHQICDEAKKKNGRIQDESIRQSILKSCDDKYAVNMCFDEDKRYRNPSKETFAGNCMNICKETKDIDLKLACTLGTINYCIENKDKIKGEGCIFSDYFNTDASTVELKDIPKTTENKKQIDAFLKKHAKEIKTFHLEYCRQTGTEKPTFCTTGPFVIPEAKDVPKNDTKPEEVKQEIIYRTPESSKDEPKSIPSDSNTKEDHVMEIIILSVFLVIILLSGIAGIYYLLPKKRKHSVIYTEVPRPSPIEQEEREIIELD